MKKLPDVLKGCSLVTLAKLGLVYNATSECIMCYPYEDGLEVNQYSTSTRNLLVHVDMIMSNCPRPIHGP